MTEKAEDLCPTGGIGDESRPVGDRDGVPSSWIDVDDKLPTVMNEHVLVKYEECDRTVLGWCLRVGDDPSMQWRRSRTSESLPPEDRIVWCVVDDRTCRRMIDEVVVTHWMLMPAELKTEGEF